MKIAYVHGSMPYFENMDVKVKEIIKGVFLELESEFCEIDLGRIHPPFFDGESTRAVDGIFERIRQSDGVVFASRTAFFSPSALLMNFLEYLGLPECEGILDEKHVMLVVFSESGGEKSALDALSNVMAHLGAYAVSRVGFRASHLDADGLAVEIIGKACEDLYRALRQNRKYLIPQDFGRPANEPPANRRQAAKVQAPDSFTDEQEEDIEELSRLFAQKIRLADSPSQAGPKEDASPASADRREESQEKARADGHMPVSPAATTDATVTTLASEISSALQPDSPEPPPRAKTAKQVTQSLPHFFQPQLSAGLRAVIQFSITGSEEFAGYLSIHSTECAYTDGTAPAPDIVIMADSGMWQDVLAGKFTAQKAFMVGGLKVRGDFVLLSKFDNLFKL